MGSLKALLVRHEGIVLRPYRDTVGKLTIGVGRNLDDVGISREEAMFLLDEDIARTRTYAQTCFPWFKDLDEVRKDVVISMIFNMGLAGFSEFKETISHIEAGRYATAATEMLRSRWAVQVKNRSIELAHMMQSGRYPKS